MMTIDGIVVAIKVRTINTNLRVALIKVDVRNAEFSSLLNDWLHVTDTITQFRSSWVKDDEELNASNSSFLLEAF